MTLDQAIVILVILFIILSLYFNWVGPGFTFTIGVIVLGIFGVLTPGEILSGFSNEQIAVIVILLIIGDTIRRSAMLDAVFGKYFKDRLSFRSYLFRMTTLVAGFSAFLNNTPLVAILMPNVHAWGKKNNISPSKLLIPLSFAAILGGCLTLIGTSTNLVVNGLVAEQDIFPEFKSLNIFDFTWVGLPMAVIGILYLILFSNKLLPDKEDVLEDFSKKQREYMVEVRVKSSSKLSGKSIEEAGLRNLPGLFLVEIRRNELTLPAVSPYTKIFENDVMYFAGETETIAELVREKNGLQLSQMGMYAKKDHTELLEVVVSYNSTLVGKVVRESNFRARFDAAIIAIHRNGEKISGKIGDVKLMAGDVLLLLAGDDFKNHYKETNEFYLISKVKEFNKPNVFNNYFLIGGTILAILVAAFKLTSLFISLTILLSLIMILKINSPKNIARSIDFNLIIVIALALALGTAMIKTGVAADLAHFTFGVLKPFGIIGIMAGVYLITTLLGALVTNKAAVALILPVALTLALEIGADPRPFALLVAFAGAASFLTPIGYQTNLMVYGPGGYNFKDFLRIGTPLTLIYLVGTVLILVWQFGLHL
ncbi:MAG: SLC13 family permease [Bacteroidota bacterium]|nr:SLC13 family permease [Bacteroidota bacterium]